MYHIGYRPIIIVSLVKCVDGYTTVIFFCQDGDNERVNGAKSVVNNEHNASTAGATAASRDRPKLMTDRKQFDNRTTNASTDAATVAASGVNHAQQTLTQITLTPPSKSGSFDVDSAASAATQAGQHTSSSTDAKSSHGTKQRGNGGLLIRGQKLLKRLTHLSASNRPGE